MVTRTDYFHSRSIDNVSISYEKFVSLNGTELKENVKLILSRKADELFYVDNSIKYMKGKRDIQTIQKECLKGSKAFINIEEGFKRL